MTILVKSVLVGLTTLSIVSNIHCQPIIRKVGSPERVVVSPGNRVSLGDGVEPNQLPIFEYTSDATRIDLGVHIRPHKKCNFTFLPRDGLTRVETIKQLGGNNKVIFVWSEERRVGRNSKFSGSSRKSATTISALNMDTCANTKNLEFAWDVKAKDNIIEVVSFEDGFDVFILKNGVGTRTSYDADGNQIGEATSFPVHSTWSSIHPVSQKSRSKGFFIVDDSSNDEAKVLNLVKTDGTVKPLREFSSLEFVSHSDESLYSICWVGDDGLTGNTVVDCAQYDESGNEKIIAQIDREFDRLVDVKSLKDGDFALFAWNYSYKKLSVIEMRPRQAFDVWSFSMEQELGKARVVDLNEKDHTFVLAYEDSVIVQEGKGVERSVALQKFTLAKSN